MIRKLCKLVLALLALSLFASCDLAQRIERKAALINNYKVVATEFAYKNRHLKIKINQLENEIQTLKTKNNFLGIKMNQAGRSNMMGGRLPASVVTGRNDLVKHGIYKWAPEQLLATAEKEFHKKNFEKSAQFFQTFITQNSEKATDQLYFQAGIAAFESGKHNDWVLQNLGEIVAKYPRSKYYRGAKLWMALTHLKMGDSDRFYATVDEFRKKYKNTPEWKILSAHYASIRKKYSK